MMVVPERSLAWIERWNAHGLDIGKHDGRGNLILTHDDGDDVALDMVSEIKSDAVLAHGVGVLVLAMLKRENEEVGRT